MGQVVRFDVLRTLAFGGISGTYAPVGTAFLYAVRLICITNNTNGDMLFSDDGINDKLFVAAGSFKLFDLTTNHTEIDRKFELAAGTQMSVKQSTAATSGAVYIECIYG